MDNLSFINSEEGKTLYRRYSDICQRMYYGQVHKTRFLTPNEVDLLVSILNQNQYNYKVFKSHQMSERRIVIFSNADLDLEEEFKEHLAVVYLESRNHGLNHRDVLGALMSLGIDRGLIGDILVSDDLVEISVLREIADFILFNIKKIKRLNVAFRLKDGIYLEDSLISYKDLDIVISSLRLDVIISAVFGLSRDKSKKLIVGGQVKLDYVICNNPAQEVAINSSISVRGFGRFYYIDHLGKTKKDKDRITIRKLI